MGKDWGPEVFREVIVPSPYAGGVVAKVWGNNPLPELEGPSKG